MSNRTSNKQSQELTIRNSTVEFLVFTQQEGESGIEVRYQDETIWLSQKLMAELFGTSTDNIGLHLKNIYAEDELVEKATTEDFSAVQTKVPKLPKTTRRANLKSTASFKIACLSLTLTKLPNQLNWRSPIKTMEATVNRTPSAQAPMPTSATKALAPLGEMQHVQLYAPPLEIVG